MSALKRLKPGLVFPAYAGVNAAGADVCRAYHGIPRVCGGEPSTALNSRDKPMYSPRMRG